VADGLLRYNPSAPAHRATTSRIEMRTRSA
jgi:hypothetical protein